MQTSSTQRANEFAGHFDSHGGSQFVGNQFNTSGGSINIDSNAGDNKLPATICELPDSLLSPYFTGRGDELQQIDRAFSTSSGHLPARCIIHGMPGLGKTQLALNFATLAFQRSHFAYVFWVSAASAEKFTQDFSKLVELLRLPGRYTSDQVTKLTMARAWLEDTTDGRSWLVVLDNVTQETTRMLLDRLPRRNSGGKLLFTTRTAKIAEMFATSGGLSQLGLQPPGIQDAVAMLLAGAALEGDGTTEVNDADAKQVVRSVGALPLAIDQAASYLRETGSSPCEILKMYKSEDAFEFLEWENDLSRHEEKSVAATFTPALDKIQRTAPDALILLRMFCFCNPESIQISIFTQGCDALHQESRRDGPPAQALNKLEAVIDLFRSPVRLSKAIEEVQRLSLATCAVNASERTIRIHDLVHLILSSRLIANAERRSWLEAAIRVICKAFEKVGDHRSPQNWNRCGQFVSHIESLEAFAEQNSLIITELLNANTRAAIYHDACGRYKKAAALIERSVDKRKVLLGMEHPRTLESMTILANAYRSQSRWKEAEDLEIQVLEIRTRVLGEENPVILIDIGNLALIYAGQRRWKEAEELLVRAMETSTRVLGKEHSYTLFSMASLARTYAGQGRWKEAEELLVRVIEIETRVLGQEHPDTLTIMDSLALTYANQGRWTEAEELQVRVMETSTRVLGQEHPKTLVSMNKLAIIMRYQGRDDEAIELMKRCVELHEQVFGLDHHYTKKSLGALHRWEKKEKRKSSVFANLGCDGLCQFNEGEGDWNGSALENFSSCERADGGRNTRRLSWMSEGGQFQTAWKRG